MRIETIFENFELLTDAPNAAAKLREIILELAVRGKLVPQDQSDETTSVLLERIKAKRRQIVQEKKLKDANSAANQVTNIPHELPASWIWLPLEQVFYSISPSQKKVKSSEVKDEGRFPVIDQGKRLIAGYVNDEEKLIKVSEPVIIFGDHTCELKYVDFEFVAGADGVKILRPICVFETYFFLVLKTIKIAERGYSRHYKFLVDNPFPLPPIAEQKRIVEKCDRLLSLCDQIEVRQQKRQESIVRMNESAIAQLLSSQNPDEFSLHWQRICNNFDLLYSIPETIPKLRQAILQLAVQGKLTRQYPDDEQALALLEKIKYQGKELSQKGILKKYRDLNPVKQDSSIYFELPSTWCWAKLGNFGDFLGGGTPSKTNLAFWNGDIPWVSPKDMKASYIFNSLDHISEVAFEHSAVQPIPEGSLLMVVRGMILAHSFPVALSMRDVAINQDMKALKLISKDVSEYLLIACKALKYKMLEKVSRSTHGTCKLSFEDVENFPIPLPPLAEQKRIVAKVDRLMSLCDTLEAKLKEARSHSEKLMEVAAKQLLVL